MMVLTIDPSLNTPTPLSQLMVPSEAAHDTVEALGSVGLLQFRDLNPEKSAFQRTYATQVRLAQHYKLALL